MKSTSLRHSSELIDTYLSQLTELIYLIAPDREIYEIVLQKSLSRIRSLARKQKFQKYVRVWIFQVVSQVILETVDRTLTHSPENERAFANEFKSLSVLDRLILIYLDRFQFPLEETAAILSIPASTLTFQRDQAIKSLSIELSGPQEISKRMKEDLNSIITEISATTPPLPRKNLSAWKAFWEDTPWYLKTFTEGAGIAAVVLTIVVVIPKLSAIYEARVNQRLDVLDVSHLDYASQPPEPPTVASSTEEAVPPATIQVPPNPTKVNDFESWDFTLLSDSPKELQAKIHFALITAGIAKDHPGINGNEVPGGIQFDLVVSKEIMIGVKNEIDRIAVTNLKPHVENSAQEPYTWHKKKSRQKIAPGQTQLVIWLPQI